MLAAADASIAQTLVSHASGVTCCKHVLLCKAWDVS